MVKRRRGGGRMHLIKHDGRTSTENTDCSSNASGDQSDDEVLDTREPVPKRMKIMPKTLDCSTRRLDDMLSSDGMESAIDFLLEIRRTKEVDLANWSRHSHDGIHVLVTTIVDTNRFLIQQCMFTALCCILGAIAKHQYQRELDAVYGLLPPILFEVLPLECATQPVDAITIRRRLNKLNRSLRKIWSFRITKCWVQEGQEAPVRF
ncbi:hypothetical protein AaE_009187 [Aphanomyces astaci]|uniref:Uncharacterized protein n=1 Tax=Aphanomyces astaci TaxID=112090 RepID=A0A6A5A5F7_APHAT|nr:hypothetical protein AaE_009187 [Aphanomyces astaci]